MVGEDVRIIARFHGIEDAAQIRALEFMAVEGPAYEAVKAGENVQDVAKRHGIVSAKAILELEGWAAFQGPAAYAAVQANDNERDVARQYGIVSADGILELEAAASLKLCSSERAARFEARRAAP